MIDICENQLQFHTFKAGKNNHGALQVLVSKYVSYHLYTVLAKFINVNDLPKAFVGNTDEEREDDSPSPLPVGINRRWRVYRYQPGEKETFAPHIDAGFPPSGLSKDGSTLLWDITDNDDAEEDEEYSDDEEIVSRLTVLIYLNGDFDGGYTRFYAPLSSSSSFGGDENKEVVASIKPKQGSILVFPQAVGEEHLEYANQYWNLHEGSAVTGGKRGKYVIRTDVLFSTTKGNKEENDVNNKDDDEYRLFQHDHLVRQTFLPKSSMINPTFLHHIRHLYNPHMGVENI
eukprot:12112311-Ditylum_brightwellii.AAC.1